MENKNNFQEKNSDELEDVSGGFIIKNSFENQVQTNDSSKHVNAGAVGHDLNIG